MKYSKVIVWGHPLYTHTHAYVHESYYKTFKYLGYETYWFHDGDFPKDFDYSNCLFITEGYADKNIPLNSTSCYMVMYCPSPIKYISANVERYIDVRMSAINHKDHIHDYSLNREVAINIGPECFYEKKTNNKIRHKNNYVDYEIEDYDKVYISWATNLLPHEIDSQDMYLSRQNAIYFCGTISGQGICENLSNFMPFIQECQKNGIQFYHNDPWSNPIPTHEMIKIVKSSLLGVDIRGPEHLRSRLLTCRVFKNISYGHLGITNSPAIQEALDGNCVYNSDTSQLFYDAMNNRENFKLISDGMKLIKEKHTYVNRINSLISIL